MCEYERRAVSGVLSLVLILGLGSEAMGQRFVTVPVGTVVPLRLDTPLSSNSSRVGDPFTATVFRSVLAEGRAILPEGAKVEGHVTGITPGGRGRGPAAIAVAFDRISLPSGDPIPLDATLTTLSEDGRRSIEQAAQNRDEGVRTRRAVVFLGATRGAGATIGIASGGADTTTVGAIIGTLLGGGERADVQAGAEFGMMVERSFSVDTDPTIARDQVDRDNRGQSQRVLSSYDSIRAAQIALRSRNYYSGPINGEMNQATREAIENFQHDRNFTLTGELDLSTARALGIPVDVGGPPTQTVFTSAEAIRFAQITLRDRGYYTGPINGVMTPTTRNAIRQLQRDRNLAMSGDLDSSTARELGIASDAGIESAAAEVANPRAERIGAGSIRISADVHTPGRGWQIFVNRFVAGNILHVYIRGVPPRYPTGSAVDHHPFTETYNDLPNVTRVIFHGPQRDFTAELIRDGGGSGIGNPRQIAFLANRLLQDFERDLNIRKLRGQTTFDPRRDFRPYEIELLSQMNSLQASAELYSQLTASVTDPEAVRGAAGGLMRQARLLERIMRRGTQLTLSSIVRTDWQQLQAELARISVTDPNVDSDIVR